MTLKPDCMSFCPTVQIQMIAGLTPLMADVWFYGCGRYSVIKHRVSQTTRQQKIMSRVSWRSYLFRFGQALAAGILIS